MEYILIAFESTHAAMACEKFLKSEFKIVMMPTLRSITTACGLSIRLDPADLPRLQKKLMQFALGSELYHVYAVQSDGSAQRIE